MHIIDINQSVQIDRSDREVINAPVILQAKDLKREEKIYLLCKNPAHDMWCEMRLIYPLIILFLLTGAAAAQLTPDKDRFDIVLHPGDGEERTLKVINAGDSTIFKIAKTEMIGDARDFIFIDVPEGKPLSPGDEAEIKIYIGIPPETKPGAYTGFIYLMESSPPSFPLRIDFHIDVIVQESYGIAMTVEDAKSASLRASAKDRAQFNLAVKNLGSFRDIASIDSGALPEGWSIFLLDDDEAVTMPYDLPLDPGATHAIKLQINTEKPGAKENVTITATSLGNRSINSSIQAEVEFGLAVRGYDTQIDVPDKIATNKSYKGSLKVILDVKENIWVTTSSPDELIVMPQSQTVKVTPENPGIANITFLASRAGDYPLTFQLSDSHGIPMPEEVITITASPAEGKAVLTGEDIIYGTLGILASYGNRNLDVFLNPPDEIPDDYLNRLQGCQDIVILGNESVISHDIETKLVDAEIKRIHSESLYEECWLFIREIWENGTAEVVLATPRQGDIFRAYKIAMDGDLPLVVCRGNVTPASLDAIKEMITRNSSLSRAMIVGRVEGNYTESLKEAGLQLEEVSA